MPIHIAFLRAVNVGGRTMRMAELRKVLEDDGFTDVETFIQTGNVRVTTPMRSSLKVAAALSTSIEQWAGFAVPAIVRSPTQLRRVATQVDGIPALIGPEARRFVAFLDQPVPAAAAAELDVWESPGERVKVLGTEIIMELSIAVTDARLTYKSIEKVVGCTATTRNIQVVRTLSEKWGT